MTGETITSARNPLVAAAVRLHRARGRREAGETLLEGPILVEEAVAAGRRLERIFTLEGDRPAAALAAAAGAPLITVDERVLKRISTTTEPQAPVAVLTIPDPSVSPGGRVIVPWGVGDPGNCGTLVRAAAAFGYGYLSGPDSADPWSPKVLRSGAGAHFRTAVGLAADLDDVRTGGRALVAAVARGGREPGPLPADAAVLVGSEAAGLPPEVVDAADEVVTIPMIEGTESLNAAVAGSIVAYLGWRVDGER